MNILTLMLVASSVFAPPRFEVASVKPSASILDLRSQGLAPPKPISDATRFQTYGSLATLIRTAYGLEQYQALSGPDWMNTTFFEINAKMPEGSTRAQAPAMLAALLADRFGLVIRHYQLEAALVYLLMTRQDGPKLKLAADGDLTSASPFPDGGNGRIALYVINNGTDGWATYSMRNRDDRTLVFETQRLSMQGFAAMLSRQVNLPVIDSTGLKEAYQISLPVPYGPNGPGRGAPVSTQAADPIGVDIFKSVEKLGLRLEKSKQPIDSLIVEHVNKTPTDN
jgi:uncharacterized protein (TIGR03435 family)